jgi:hypothetical protein
MPAGISYSGGGRTAYGKVPDPIPIPPNLFTQLGKVPGFTANTAGTGSVIGSELSGNVSPQTLAALKTGAAQFGVASGMPGSGLESNQLFGNIAGFSEGQQEKGVRNYLSEVGALGPTMTNPNLAADISARNANLAAAPDPKMAAEQAFNDWLRGFNYTRSASMPTGSWAAGGTLGPAPYGATVGRTYPGGVAGFGYGGTDALGFPNYNMQPEGQGVYTATATPPPGGWPGAQPWNAGFAASSNSDGVFFNPESGQEEPLFPFEQG